MHFECLLSSRDDVMYLLAEWLFSFAQIFSVRVCRSWKGSLCSAAHLVVNEPATLFMSLLWHRSSAHPPSSCHTRPPLTSPVGSAFLRPSLPQFPGTFHPPLHGLFVLACLTAPSQDFSACISVSSTVFRQVSWLVRTLKVLVVWLTNIWQRVSLFENAKN